MIAVSNVCWRSFGTRLPLAGLVAFSHLQFSQIRGRQPYSIVRKIPYLIRRTSLAQETVRILRLVEILGSIESDRLDQPGRGEVRSIEIGAANRDAGERRTAQGGAPQRSVGKIRILERCEFEVHARQIRIAEDCLLEVARL